MMRTGRVGQSARAGSGLAARSASTAATRRGKCESSIRAVIDFAIPASARRSGNPMNTILTLLGAEQMRRYSAAGLWGDGTIYALARQHAERAPARHAVRERGRRISYGELIAAADRLAADLDTHGVRAGQRVAVWLPSRLECAVALL